MERTVSKTVPSKLSPDTREESFADVRTAGGTQNTIGPVSLNNSNLWVSECAARKPARPSRCPLFLPASPRPPPPRAHTHTGVAEGFPILCGRGAQTHKFMVADPTGEEWVLPAGTVPLAGADRKIGMLLMSSQRKPLTDKRVVVFLPSPFMLPGVFK